MIPERGIFENSFLALNVLIRTPALANFPSSINTTVYFPSSSFISLMKWKLKWLITHLMNEYTLYVSNLLIIFLI